MAETNQQTTEALERTWCANCKNQIHQVNGKWFHVSTGILFCNVPAVAVPAHSSIPIAPVVDQNPIDMILFCPRCGTQHVDAPEDETGFRHRMEAFGLVAEPQDSFPTRWTNPPHKSHLCHQCGAVWRPADVATNGVAEIATRGERDNIWTNSVAAPASTQQSDGS